MTLKYSPRYTTFDTLAQETFSKIIIIITNNNSGQLRGAAWKVWLSKACEMTLCLKARSVLNS